jgi:hypothetical protein
LLNTMTAIANSNHPIDKHRRRRNLVNGILNSNLLFGRIPNESWQTSKVTTFTTITTLFTSCYFMVLHVTTFTTCYHMLPHVATSYYISYHILLHLTTS